MRRRNISMKNFKSCTVIIGRNTHLLAVMETEEGQFRISALRPTTHKDFEKGKLAPQPANTSLWKKRGLVTLIALSAQGKRALRMGIERLEELVMGEHDVIHLYEVEVGTRTFPIFTKEVECDQPTATQ